MSDPVSSAKPSNPDRTGLGFYGVLWVLGSPYLLLLTLLIVAVTSRASLRSMAAVLSEPAVRSAVGLTLASSVTATLLAIVATTPLAYLTSRRRGTASGLLNAVLDLPNVLPPLVLGLLLLIAFRVWPASLLSDSVVYQPAAVVLAQFVVASSFALPALRTAFDQIPPDGEEVALTLGCNRRQAFVWVTLAEVWPSLLTVGAVAWARCVGTFGPILVFAGTTRNKTEVLATTIYLELTVGDLESALAVALLMIVAAVGVLWGVRLLAARPQDRRGGER